MLESILGKGLVGTNNEVSFYCPFCNHYKTKLGVNLSSQYWHCWVCDTKGRKLYQLFNKINANIEQKHQLNELLGEYRPDNVDKKYSSVFLPKDYISLWLHGNSPERKHALKYLRNRGVTTSDILKYQIGYCEIGPYKGMVIIPSYDENGRLNFFVGRSFYPDSVMKHKNPVASKNIIPLELFVSWDFPIILCEGMFDAIAIKRNAIPLLGKSISNKLMKKIIQKTSKKIYIALDEDALSAILKHAETFLGLGKEVYLVKLSDKDPAAVGFDGMRKLIESATSLDEIELMKLRLSLC